jgi:hypothetical protein
MMRRTFKPAIAPASLVACRCASLKKLGTVMTALCTRLPKCASAASFILDIIIADISSGEKYVNSPSAATLTYGRLWWFTTV